ncbi:MAG: cation:proton antiporter [Candidatus Woesearchaeota archaeon]|nr:cation:proton antiporter [Candidatus Woesearchaeota archaeon]
MANPLFVTLIALIIAYLFAELFQRFNLPRVVGQILAGMVLGIPLIHGFFFTPEVTAVFSYITNIGIILLFFFVGLEINLLKFKKNVRESALIALFNTALPLIGGFVASRYLFHLDLLTSLILGIAVAVSSQAISLDILEEMRLIKSKIGNLIITSGAVDDVFELFLISTILVLFSTVGQPNIGKLLVDSALFILIVLLFRVSLIPFAMRIFERDKSQSTLFMGALIIVLLMASLSEMLGISSLIGALIAGMLVRHSLLTGHDRKPWRKNELSHSIHVIAFGFLIPLFFVNVGMNTDLSSISANLPLIGVLLLIDIVGTVAGSIIGVVLSGKTVLEGLLVGWGVTPKGDTELVIATVALNAGLITLSIYSAIIMVAIATTFIGPIVFKWLVEKHRRKIQ